MRAFIVLCLVAAACADKLGYNYSPVGHSDSGLSFAPGASNDSPSYASPSDIGSSYAPAPSSYAPQPSASANLPSSYAPIPSASVNSPSSFAPSSGAPDAAQSVAAPSYSAPAQLEKEFFSFSADENDFNEPAASDQIANNLNKGLRVVFIKGPEHNSLEDAALALAKQGSQEETAIYVLNKQADIGDLANKLNSVRSNNNNKPEVHFVKYRTPEDAANAQKAIQGQYDQLGGSSQNHEGGVAPALNFASPVPAPAAPAPQSPENSYLPASILRHRL